MQGVKALQCATCGTQYGVQDAKLCEMLNVQHGGKWREVNCTGMLVLCMFVNSV